MNEDGGPSSCTGAGDEEDLDEELEENCLRLGVLIELSVPVSVSSTSPFISDISEVAESLRVTFVATLDFLLLVLIVAAVVITVLSNVYPVLNFGPAVVKEVSF